MTDKTRLRSTIYIGNLDLQVTPSTLHSAFIPFGNISDISLPKPEAASNTDPHRGFGYVEFEAEEDAREAIENMNQSELFGKVMKVAAAKPQREQNEGLGSKVAVWEQEGYLARHAVSEEDKMATEGGAADDGSVEPMQGLEGLDVAGPKMA